VVGKLKKNEKGREEIERKWRRKGKVGKKGRIGTGEGEKG